MNSFVIWHEWYLPEPVQSMLRYVRAWLNTYHGPSGQISTAQNSSALTHQSLSRTIIQINTWFIVSDNHRLHLYNMIFNLGFFVIQLRFLVLVMWYKKGGVSCLHSGLRGGSRVDSERCNCDDLGSSDSVYMQSKTEIQHTVKLY
jgi:hypothetical protein